MDTSNHTNTSVGAVESVEKEAKSSPATATEEPPVGAPLPRLQHLQRMGIARPDPTRVEDTGEYRRQKLRWERTRSRLIFGGIAVIVLGTPVAYLLLTGSLGNPMNEWQARRRQAEKDAKRVAQARLSADTGMGSGTGSRKAPIASAPAASAAKEKPAPKASSAPPKSGAHAPPRVPIVEQGSYQGVDPVAEDLTTYVTIQVPGIVSYEQEALAAFSQATGFAYQDDATSARIVRTQVMPRYREYIAEAEKIKPETAPVRALHQLLLRAARSRLAAFDAMASANTKDSLWRVRVSAAQADADADQKRYMESLQKLGARYGLAHNP